MKKSRIWELDFFRGFAIVMVVIDHAMYDFCSLFPSWRNSDDFLHTLYTLGVSYMNGPTRAFWRPAFLFLFFSISGICTAFSHNNFVRGIRLFTVAALLSLVTYLAQKLMGENCFILLGVLHCLALITLLYSIVDGVVQLVFKLLEKKGKNMPTAKKIVESVLLVALSVSLFFIHKTYNVSMQDAFAYGSTIPYDHDWRGLFFYESSWWTADYFPLFPFISFFFFGAGLAELLYPKRRSLLPELDGAWHNVFSVPGRYSLWVYLAGQVVVIGLCYLLTFILQ